MENVPLYLEDMRYIKETNDMLFGKYAKPIESHVLLEISTCYLEIEKNLLKYGSDVLAHNIVSEILMGIRGIRCNYLDNDKVFYDLIDLVNRYADVDSKNGDLQLTAITTLIFMR